MPPKRMLFIFNPVSGRQDIRFNLFEIVDLFVKRGFEVTVHPTQERRDAYETALRRGASFDCLVCSGGDGTLREVVEAVMRLPRRPPFGYIPSGTTNDFAASLGLPGDALQAAASVCDGRTFSIDVGRFGENYFSYVAAFGLFTDVSYGTSQSVKNLIGHAAYVLEGVKRLASISSCRCAVTVDDARVEGEFILGLVGNSTSIGGFQMPMESQTLLDDGLFEVVLLRKPSSFADLQNVIASLLNGEKYTDSLIIQKASSVMVEPLAGPLHWTLDGEDGGERGRVEIVNCPRAIDIIVPREEP